MRKIPSFSYGETDKEPGGFTSRDRIVDSDIQVRLCIAVYRQWPVAHCVPQSGDITMTESGETGGQRPLRSPGGLAQRLRFP